MRNTFICLFSFLLSSGLLAQKNNKTLKITPLCKDAYVFTTYNEYKGELVPANGMYIVTNSGVVMLDSPWDTLQFQPLLDSIENRHHQKVVLCIATHSHDDRTAGLEYYRMKGAKTYTSKQTYDICKEKNEKQSEFYFTKDTLFTICDKTFQTFYPGEGHTKDNIVIWLEKEKIIYGGCFVKSVESKDLGNLNDANPKEWKISIKKVMTRFPKANYVIPGHFDWSNKNSMKHTLKLIEKHLKN